MAFNVQFKRSSILEKRPVAANMLDGEINLNINPDSTGLFFKDDNGYVVKVGPAHMGPVAPNSTPGAGGSGGNSIGEFWYDTENSLLKIFDGVSFVAVESGEVRTVSGVGAISVDSSDAENPVISVAAASTSTAGVVQLVDNTSSTSTTQALTANQGKVLQDQINSLSLSSNITLGGTFDPATGLMVTVTAQGTNQGFVVGAEIPSAIGNAEMFVISEGYSSDFTAPGGTSEMYHVGDWLLSDGAEWNFLDVGHQPASATDSYAGVVELATDAETQAGVNSTSAVTPASLQSKVSDSNSLNSSTTLASSQALSTERDERIAGDAALTSALNDEAARAQLAEATNAASILAEETRALAAEAAINLAASDEEAARIAADAALQSAIDAEEARAIAAEAVLTSNLAAETSARTTADSQLQAAIDAEEVRASDAEAVLQANIDAEAVRAAAAEAVNADAITALEVSTTAAMAAEEAARIAADDAEAAARAAADTAEAAARTAADDAEAAARAAADTAEADARAAADATLQSNLDSEVSRAVAAEATLQSNLDAEIAARTNADDDEAVARAEADVLLQSNIDAEQARAAAAEAALDVRVSDIEENLDTEIISIFENATSVIADGASPIRDPGYNDGWSYTNEAGQKVNWYFYDGVATPSTFATASFYSVITLNSNSAGDVPFLSVYSAMTGTDDAGSWYKSRKTAHVADPTALTVGKKYLFVFGEDPKVHPELERVFLTVDASSSVGTQADSEALSTVALSSNSGSAAGAVNFLAESVGVKTEEGADTKYLFRFRKPTVLEMEEADATIQAIAEAAIPDATMTAKGDLIVGTGDSTYVSVGAGSNGQILMADSSTTSGLGWFTTDAGTY